MKPRVMRTVILLSLAAVMTMSLISSDAMAARRSALAGNQLIEDMDDLFAFPHLMMKYKDLVTFDLAPYNENGLTGSASVVFGTESLALNFNTGRTDYLDNVDFWGAGGYDQLLYGMNTVVPDIFPLAPLQFWDLGVAFNVGETAVGGALSWASDADKYTEAGGTVTNDETLNIFSLQASMGMDNLDLAGEITFGGYTDNLDDSNSLDIFEMAATLRGYVDDVMENNWGYVGSFSYIDFSPQVGESASMTFLHGAFGPTWGTEGDWTAAAYLYAEYWTADSLVNLGDKSTYWTLPGMNFALEYYLNDWFAVRTGLVSYYEFDKEEYANADDTTDEETYRYYDLYWTAGLGIDRESWGLDLALNQADLHSGYLPFNGSVSSEPISLISVWKTW
jgi:hypothetical protein